MMAAGIDKEHVNKPRDSTGVLIRSDGELRAAVAVSL